MQAPVVEIESETVRRVRIQDARAAGDVARLLRAGGGTFDAEHAEIAQPHSRIRAGGRIIRRAVGMRAESECIGQADPMRRGEAHAMVAVAADAGLRPHQPDRVRKLVQAAAQQPVGQVGRAARALDDLPRRVADQHFDMPQARVARDVVELETARLDGCGVDANAVDVDLDFSRDRRRADETRGRAW